MQTHFSSEGKNKIKNDPNFFIYILIQETNSIFMKSKSLISCINKYEPGMNKKSKHLVNFLL